MALMPRLDRRKVVILFAFFVYLFSRECGAMQLEPSKSILGSHYILAHKDGYPIDDDFSPLRKDKFLTERVEEILQGIDLHVKETWEKSKRREAARILIFAHGGLNPYEVGLGRVETLLRSEEKGLVTHRLLGKSSYYPVFINWNSSFGSSVYDDLFEVRRGERIWWLGYMTSPFILAARVAQSGFTAPRAWWYMWENWWESFSTPTEREKSARQEQGYINTEFINRVFTGISYVFLFPLRAVTQPIIQAFGTPAWEMMKRRADLVVAKRLLPVDGHSDEGAAWLLMEELRKRIPTTKDAKPIKGEWETKDKEKGPIEITLVGHSMGTLILDRILQAFPEIHFRRVLYLASASSIEDFETFVIPYLNEHQDSEFSTMSLFYTDEAWEVNYHLFFVDRGSLLVWIDNFFENVITPRQKRLGKYRNFEEYTYRRRHDGQAIYILNSELFPKANVKGKRFTGAEGHPTEHGDFTKRDILRKILCMVDQGAFEPPSCLDAYDGT